MTTTKSLLLVVSNFPLVGFAQIHYGQGLLVEGMNASGKNNVMFDIGGQAILDGRHIGIIADEYAFSDSVDRIFQSMKKLSMLASLLDDSALRKMMERKITLFSDFSSYKKCVERGNEDAVDLDLLLCDIIPLGTESVKRSDILSAHVEYLNTRRKDTGLAVVFLTSSFANGVHQSEVSPIFKYFDRRFVTTRSQNEFRVEELNITNNTLIASHVDVR